MFQSHAQYQTLCIVLTSDDTNGTSQAPNVHLFRAPDDVAQVQDLTIRDMAAQAPDHWHAQRTEQSITKRKSKLPPCSSAPEDIVSDRAFQKLEPNGPKTPCALRCNPYAAERRSVKWELKIIRVPLEIRLKKVGSRHRQRGRPAQG